ncbi:hypothetical protein CDL12_04981 [Handroanthus impetiginosus]|uniref:Uncharacterized protein n=1 Tax=Handroanthus impetiginosus TaxID=429701 RepID=A0A2G9HXT8_9LAMI|nr:hypothetical protein CDL12_04981 [Handroanthus impetiginosus]
MKEICKILDTKEEKMLELMIEVLGAFGRALKVNAYDSVRVVDSLYRSKYFLTSLPDRADTHLKRQKKKTVDEHMPLDLDNPNKTVAALENEISMDTDDVHRITILNCPEGDAGPPTEMLTKDKITGYQHSAVAPPEIDRVENFELHCADTHICRPLLPWMNGNGTINEPVYKGLIRRVLGIVMQNPGILEDGIITQMKSLNPQSCRQLLEIMIMDKHIITRKMYEKTSTHQPPSILANLVGDGFRKSKLISRVHYFANPMSTTML